MISTRTKRAMDFPINWDVKDVVDETMMSVRQRLAREADALAQDAAWLSAYLDQRGAAGCGDNGHEEAVKYADKRKKQIRKVLGYTYP